MFIRRTDGESLAQIRAEKSNPRADIYHAAESASAKQLAAEGLLEAYKSPQVAELHDWAQRIAEENKYFQTPIYTGVLGLGLQHRAPRQEEAAGAEVLGGPRQSGLQGRDPDGQSGHVRHGVQHGVDDPADDGRRPGLQVPGRDEQERQSVHALGQRRHPRGRQGRDARSASRSCTIRWRKPSRAIPIKTIAPCEGTGYEIISSAIIKNGPNPEGAKKWMDFVLSPAGQNVAVTVNKFQIPSNKNAQIHPMAPKPSEVKLINLDLDKYGSKEGRERLLSRWENEVFKAPK